MHYKKTPPIQWLPVFEAAARLLSFKDAAEELHVTPPAISQQIGALEHWLELELFERKARKLTLTPAGQYYLKVAQKILFEHVQGYLELERRFKTKALNISAPLFLAQELLIPNYLSFADFVPGIELRLETRMSLVDFENEALDAAIRFGDGNWPGLDCRKLGDSHVSIVCSQKYLDKHGPIDINNLANHRLLSISAELSDWSLLLGHPIPKQQSRIICDSYMATIKSAAEGLGIAAGIFPLVSLWVNSKKLISPLATSYSNGNTYWLVSPSREEQTDAIEGLYKWVKALLAQLAD
ncbi:MAG: LysR family glycine cleavage system transcriptional activator [Pseudomonadales bacterium]|jgi:LysR family glycine cleavage system transcriptional activator